MKTWILVLLLVGTFCVSSTLAKIESEIALVEDEEAEILLEEEDGDGAPEAQNLVEPDAANDEDDDEEEEEEEAAAGETEEEEEDERPIPRGDPCNDMYCGAGRECIINEEGEGECLCQAVCEEEIDPRRKVCSNLNETWVSDCELYRQRCLCEDEEPACTKEAYAHMHIDYYGECQEFRDCQESELEDFPRRMKEWLFSIMRDMADRKSLSEHYLALEQEAEEDSNKQWTNAVVWKWCDLDSYPRDRSVSRHELFPIRAPLMSMEHCIGTFLDSCDPNDDHYVSLKEWAACTKLSVNDTTKLEDLCEGIRDN
ncbi:SPARC-like isoform X2 [Macrobrachium nipponense]|uniref:SPARC-like isoform X2 n=1 Tax=Macrobrachium nipponense TaxID=159736 RepID=UPI0030C7E428